MKRGIGAAVTVGALLAALLLVACGSDSSASGDPGGSPSSPSGASAATGSLQASNGSGSEGISVSGEGRVAVTPDMALLSIGVSTKEDTVAAANSAVQAAMDRLLNSLKGNGIVEKDIQTSQFSINPEYDYQLSEPRLTGYRVTHTLQVKVRQIDQAGKVIDDGVEAAGDLVQVGSISLTVDDTSAMAGQARELAMADAKGKAEDLARLAGVELGKPISISESSYTPSPPVVYDRAAFSSEAAAPAATTISTGELEVVVSVQITYAIG
jgi:uncharacterized protein YggE